jgi:hypothetical protein
LARGVRAASVGFAARRAEVFAMNDDCPIMKPDSEPDPVPPVAPKEPIRPPVPPELEAYFRHFADGGCCGDAGGLP